MMKLSVRNKLISNSAFLLLNWASDTFLYMLFWLILAKILSSYDYGIVATAMQVAVLLSNVALFGLDMSANKLIAEWNAKKKTRKIHALTRVSMILVFIISTVLALGFAIFYLISPGTLKMTGDAVVLVVLSTIIFSMYLILENFYFGFQNMKKIFTTRLVGDVAMVVLGAALAYLWQGYVGALVGVLISAVLLFLIRMRKDFLFGTEREKLDTGLIIKYSLPAFLVMILAAISQNTQFIILTSMQGPAITGIFAVAMKIVVVLSVISATFSRSLFPVVSELSTSKKASAKSSYLVTLVFRYGAVVTVILTGIISMLSVPLVLFFSNTEKIGAAGYVPVLAIGAAFLGIANPILMGIFAIGEPKKYRNCYIASTAVYLVSAPVLTYLYSGMGLAAAYMLSSLALLISGWIYAKRSIGFGVPIIMWIKIGAALAISMAYLWFCLSLVHVMLLQFAAGASSAVLYFLVLLPLRFYNKDDLKVFDYMVEKIPFKEAKQVMLWGREVICLFID
jgi:O-antigen/teichoic acid export membrane protein